MLSHDPHRAARNPLSASKPNAPFTSLRSLKTSGLVQVRTTGSPRKTGFCTRRVAPGAGRAWNPRSSLGSSTPTERSAGPVRLLRPRRQLLARIRAHLHRRDPFAVRRKAFHRWLSSPLHPITGVHEADRPVVTCASPREKRLAVLKSRRGPEPFLGKLGSRFYRESWKSVIPITYCQFCWFIDPRMMCIPSISLTWHILLAQTFILPVCGSSPASTEEDFGPLIKGQTSHSSGGARVRLQICGHPLQRR